MRGPSSQRDRLIDMMDSFSEQLTLYRAKADESASLMARIKEMSVPLPDLDQTFAGAHPDDIALLRSFPSVRETRAATDPGILAVIDAAVECSDRRRAISLLGWAIVAAQETVTMAEIELWWDASPATAWVYRAAGFTPAEVRAGAVPSVDEVRGLAALRGVTVPLVRPLP